MCVFVSPAAPGRSEQASRIGAIELLAAGRAGREIEELMADFLELSRRIARIEDILAIRELNARG